MKPLNRSGNRAAMPSVALIWPTPIAEHKLFRITQYEELGDTRRLTICNLWRIERLPDASLRTLEFRLTTVHGKR